MEPKLVREDLFREYKKYLKVDIEKEFGILKDKTNSEDDFKFYLAKLL